MHILHVTPYYAPAYAFGGVVRAVEGLARAQIERGHRVTVLTTDAFDQAQRYSGPMREQRDGVRVVRVPNLSVRLRGRYNLSTPPEIRALARDLIPGADVVHLHEFRTVENVLIAPAAIAHDKPLVLSPHGTLDHTTGRGTLKRAWDRLLSPRLVPAVRHVVALTEAELDDAQALWLRYRPRAETQFSIVPNGVRWSEFATLPDKGRFRERYRLGSAPLVLFLGRLHRRKGVDVLLEAFNQAAVAEAKLAFVGPDDGMLAALQTRADARVIFTGFLEGRARLEALVDADLFVLPAIGEGLPLAALEAMAVGLPVILSPDCHLPDVLPAGAGMVVEPLVEPLADALRALLPDADLRWAMGAAARAMIHERFTWVAVAQKMDQVYASLGQTPLY